MRYRLMRRLLLAELPVSALTAELPVSRPAVSQHLRVLLEAGLVTRRRSGRLQLYRGDAAALSTVANALLELDSGAGMTAIVGGDGIADADPVDRAAASLVQGDSGAPTLIMASATRLQLIGRLFQKLNVLSARSVGITAPDIFLLGTLWRLGAPYAATPTQLSQAALLSLPVMTKRLQPLLQRGLIRREPLPDDARASLIVLTRGGAELAAYLIARHVRLMTALFSTFERAPMQRFGRQLRSLHQALEALVEAQADGGSDDPRR